MASPVETAVRELEMIQRILIRVHSLLAHEELAANDRHRIDGYFDAFASDLTGLEEYLRGIGSEEG